MRVLAVSAFCPHARADSAGVLDVFHMLRHLARSHEVTVVCPVSGLDEPSLPSLEDAVHRVVTVRDETFQRHWLYVAKSAISLLTPWPAIAFVANHRPFRRAIQRTVAEGEFDVAHFAFTQTAHLRSLLPSTMPVVMDESDIAFERRRRFAKTVRNPITRYAISWDCRKLERYELDGLSSFDAVLFRTRREERMLRTATRIRRSLVVPPWVDVSFRDEVPPRPTNRDVLFFSALWRRVNDDAAVWMAKKIFPLVRARVPDAKLLLVGSRPGKRLLSLASDGIEVPGFVESVAPYYKRSAVVVAPLRAGSGIKGKVLQALGVGRPVVATPIGAEGISATENDGLFVRDNVQDIAQVIVELIEGTAGDSWHRAGRDYFDREYSFERGCREWEALLEGLATEAGSEA